jgi:hypothetical protein
MDLPLGTISLLRPLSRLSSSDFVLPLQYSHSVAEFKLLIHQATPSYEGTPLGPTNPPLTYIAEETLDFRRHSFSLCSRYSYRHSHFYVLHRTLQFCFAAHRTLPYQSFDSLSSAKSLILDKFSAPQIILQ